VKAGVIKVATGFQKISECEMAALKAAARAHRETGVPILTHTERGTMGPEQLDVLLGEGVDPRKIMCGHMCGNASIEYHKDVLSRGTFISFDRFGIEVFLPDKTREETLISLLNLGYGDRILVSQDCFGCGMGRGGRLPDDQVKLLLNWDYTNIFRNILPDLKKAGVSQDKIDALLVDNPRRLFS